VATLARTVARRGVLVLVPVPGSEDPSLVGGYAKSFRVPVDVATVSAFDRERRAESPRTRAEYAWRLYRWSAALLSAR
jgi:hypothetical protein